MTSKETRDLVRRFAEAVNMSGKKLRVDLGAVLRVENAKIAELWITWDNMTVLSQLGHLPAVPTVAA
jgi:hypothetical protein